LHILSNFVDGPNFKIDLFFQQDVANVVLARVVSLMKKSSNIKILAPGIRFLGNVSSGEN